jgi:hypothetical protein
MSDSETNWIDSRLVDGVRIVTITVGRLNPKEHLRKEFAQTLADAVAAGDRRFVLNLSQVRYTNHTYGILQLAFTAGNVLHGTGSRIAVCGLKGHPRRAYLFSDIEQFIPEFRTERRAIAHVSQPVLA